MADPNVTRGLRMARTEFAKRGIEIGRADLRITHGVLQIRGTISRMRGVTVQDLKAEVELVGKVLRQKPEIKDVIIDCRFYE